MTTSSQRKKDKSQTRGHRKNTTHYIISVSMCFNVYVYVCLSMCENMYVNVCLSMTVCTSTCVISRDSFGLEN